MLAYDRDGNPYDSDPVIQAEADRIAQNDYKCPYERLSIMMQHLVWTQAESVIIDGMREG